ncbi:armadillo-type protein [Mycena sanguinolenta]|nr:armadillo-type protein [Mycena sanguinolenta]
MPPLQRWPTRESILSWWSDSNSLGATIPLHTLSKPLMKHLYHRQAIGLISGSPLSMELVEVLTTYLDYKEISSSTRLLVLDHLRHRAQNSEDEAHMVVNALTSVKDLLHSSRPDILSHTCRLFRTLTYYESLQKPVIHLDPFPQLVSLLSHKRTRVQEEAVNALGCISAGSDGPNYVVRSNALDHCMKLLGSKNLGVRLHTCWMLGNIARWPAFNRVVQDLDVVGCLVSLLQPCSWQITGDTAREIKWSRLSQRDSHMVLRNVVYALACISVGSESGAQAVVHAKVLVHFPRLLQSPNTDVVRLACRMLGDIARHPQFKRTLQDLRFLTGLVLLLKHISPCVRQEAKFALRCIIAEDLKPAADFVADRATEVHPLIITNFTSGTVKEIVTESTVDECAGWSEGMSSFGRRPWILGASIDTAAF